MEDDSFDDNVCLVTPERISQSLKRLDYKYFVDEKGNFCTLWNQYIVIHISAVHGYPMIINTTFHRLASMTFANPYKGLSENINDTFINTKSYVTSDDEGITKFHFETVLEVGAGLNDKQLDNFIACAVKNILEAYMYIESTFPDPLAVDGGIYEF